MTKSPAFLFYTNDFFTGTLFFTDEQIGKLIRLFCMQHQHGHLSEQQVMQICKTYDTAVMSKFKKDDAGNYFNERLETEILKRNAFTESRADNRKGKAKRTKKHMKNISKTYEKHMENENVNDNVIVNEEEKEKGVQGKKQSIPGLDEFLAYASTNLNGKFRSYEFSLRTKYQAWKESGWVDGLGNPIINWKTKLLNTLPHLRETEPVRHEPPPIPIFKRE